VRRGRFPQLNLVVGVDLRHALDVRIRPVDSLSGRLEDLPRFFALFSWNSGAEDRRGRDASPGDLEGRFGRKCRFWGSLSAIRAGKVRILSFCTGDLSLERSVILNNSGGLLRSGGSGYRFRR
jgi:hypothetical protein